MNEQSGVGELKGIGEKTEKLFQKLGVFTVGDLIRYFPRGYDVYDPPVSIGEIQEQKVQAVRGMIYGTLQVSSRGGSGDKRISKRHDGNNKSCLVPDAFSEKYTAKWSDCDSARKGCDKKGS